MVVERHQWNPDTRHFECICTDTFRMSTIKACITPEHGGTS
jgi:hypothetical protein